MLKYPCLILDHDDTIVQTERAIGYPYFRDYLRKIRGVELSFREYVRDCYNMEFADMCRKKWHFTDAEHKAEYEGWQAYCADHIPPFFPGTDAVIRRQKAEGGLVCVVSLSSHANITRDYEAHFGFQPDAVYDYDMPRPQRKPNPWPLEDIMQKFRLRPADLLMVDDMKLGWTMAQAAGVKTAFAAWARKDFPDLEEEMRAICDYSFDTARELEHFLFE